MSLSSWRRCKTRAGRKKSCSLGLQREQSLKGSALSLGYRGRLFFFVTLDDGENSQRRSLCNNRGCPGGSELGQDSHSRIQRSTKRQGSKDATRQPGASREDWIWWSMLLVRPCAPPCASVCYPERMRIRSPLYRFVFKTCFLLGFVEHGLHSDGKAWCCDIWTMKHYVPGVACFLLPSAWFPRVWK